MADARRTGILILVILFAGALLVARAPWDVGAVRLGGVSLLWWYTILVAPLIALAVTIAFLTKLARDTSTPSVSVPRAPEPPDSRAAVPRAPEPAHPQPDPTARSI